MSLARCILALALAAGTIACNELAGIPGSVTESESDDASLDSSPDADAAPPVCASDADFGNNCHVCRDQNCCGGYLACHNSVACGDYLDCVSACPNESCVLECIQQHADGHAIAAPYVACTLVNCPGPCGDLDAGACAYCQESNCAKPVYGCASDPACDTLRTCIEACGAGNDSCIQACKSGTSTATQDLYNALFACGVTYCTNVCS